MSNKMLVFEHCTVVWNYEEKWLVTHFTDGTKVESAPNYDWLTMERAYSLGYGTDSWLMSMEHEIFHTWEAITRGNPYSPALWAAAHPYEVLHFPDGLIAFEENVVCDAQFKTDKNSPRPWEDKVELC